MHLIVLDYVAPLAEIDAALDAHVAWLDRHYEQGLFLASGRREPRVGGVIMASGSLAEVERAVASDPFGTRGLARHTIIEFHPTKLGGPFDTDQIRGSIAPQA